MTAGWTRVAVAVAGAVVGLSAGHAARLVAEIASGAPQPVRVASMAASPAWRVSLASAYSRAGSPGRMACTGALVPWDRLEVAHKQLPCGTRVRICAQPGRCVTAVVADRGPFITGRSLDLTPGVFRALGAGSAVVWGVRRVWWRVLP